MSRIYFHSPSGDAALLGSERAYMGWLCASLALGVFEPHVYGSAEVLARVWRHPYPTAATFPDAFSTHVRIGGDRIPFTLRDGREADMFSVNLNTALVLGNDAVRLCARLHGQCELHAWVAGEHRAWLAGIIDAGRRDRVLRENQGWEGVAAFLRANSEEPVVTSYSVTDSFPSAFCAGITDDVERDAWYNLPPEAQWRSAFDGLTASGGGLQLRPDRWTYDGFYFEHGENAFTVLEHAAAMAPTHEPVP